MKHQLLKYQDKDADRIENRYNGRCLISWDMGLGKSCVSITNILRHGPHDRPIVIVTYASLKWNWQRELKLWGWKREGIILSSRSIHNPPPTKIQRTQGDAYIINYDILPDWLPWLKRLRPKAIIIDECQAIKNQRTKRTKSVRKLCRKAPKILMLSGTPMVNQAVELFPALNILKPEEFPSFHQFAARYSRAKRTPWGLKFHGAKNLDELHERLKEHVMIRRLKRDVLKQLPGKRRHILPVDLPEKQLKEYREANQSFVRWLSKTAIHMRSSSLRMKKIAKMMGMKKLIALLKLPLVIEWINLFLEDTNEKLIVFGIHKKVLKRLYKKFKDKSVLVNGEVIGKEKERRFQKFIKDKNTRILFGNIQAAGTGWNGTVASTVLFVEMGWTPGEHTQAEDRIHRIGQTHGANIYYMVVKDTIEYHLCRIIQEKQSYTDQALDGKPEKTSTFGIHDLLERKLVKEGRKK